MEKVQKLGWTFLLWNKKTNNPLGYLYKHLRFQIHDLVCYSVEVICLWCMSQWLFLFHRYFQKKIGFVYLLGIMKNLCRIHVVSLATRNHTIIIIIIFCYCPKYFFRLIEGQQSAGVGVRNILGQAVVWNTSLPKP